ncbi:hypothetical protein CBP76_05255 [Companilactobacillus nuruki]|uniref:BspA family leucine-rich repeat surface protein n=2 Tax=Companilactobacillus nuruki TaxID=1993540 RepID=A0A2N7AUU3_9LACO|nr:BspA family leucine-rich repeat surface protein [Companilactobacillus nuruki]PMD71389.1 hypothetical protein CBP76_05255 [Companilactobacillus nuruki]
MDTSQVTNMSRMFLNCRSLKSLDLSDLDTSKVEDMSNMFNGCSNLKALDLTKFDTSQVTDMDGMFAGCESLEELDLSTFDTRNVKSMKNVFESVDALKTLKLGKNFVTSKDQKNDSKLIEKTWINIGKGTVNNPKPENKMGISSSDLLSCENKGEWVVKPMEEYHGPYIVQVTNNLDDNLGIVVPKKLQPEYVGSTFDLVVPERTGYTVDKKTISVMTLKNRLSSVDTVTYTPIPEKKKTVLKTDSSVSENNNYVALHSDLKNAKLYDVSGQVRKHVLSQGDGWLSDKILKISNNKYYHVAGDDWVKSDDVYLYKDVKNRVKTKDVLMTTLVDSHAREISNRGLGALSTWDTDEVAIIKGHRYYRVSHNEFIDSDKVDIVRS